MSNTDKQQTDIVILSLPSLILDRAPGAPALLKSACLAAGFNAKTIDLSLDFFNNEGQRDLEKFNKLSLIFHPSTEVSEESKTAKDTWLARAINTIKELDTPVVGLSVFTTFQHRAALLLTEEIRKQLPDVKIIVGGMGLNINCTSLSNLIRINKLEILNPFHVYLKLKNLYDHCVLGVDGLDGIVEYLEKELGVRNVDKEQPTEVLKRNQYSTPIPDYTDYRLDDYLWTDGKALPITGSKGCVRNCTFCDIPGQFGKFRMRTGKDIGKEIVYMAEKYGIRKFEFTDSLVNGSLKVFEEWMSVVADYNDQQTDENKIRWFGQYICRPQKQTAERYYSLMSRSGVSSLVIGTESGSNEVLEAMQKKMTVEDVYAELDMFTKHKITAQLLMFSGFYNETKERFYDTLKFLIKCQQYVASGTINKFSLGFPLYITSDTHIYDHATELGLELDPYLNHNWTSKDDPDNTFPNRSFNRLIQQELMELLNYPYDATNVATMIQLDQYLSQTEKELEKELEKKMESYAKISA